MKYIIFFASIFLLESCVTSRVVNFPTKENEIIVNNNLKTFFKNNPQPKIVLRVPNSDDKATSNSLHSQDAGILYNAIEKEFLKEGYSVRDRGLFNEIINKSGSTQYSKIKEITDTDLILEVVNIDRAVIYSTNKVTQTSGKKISEIVSNVEYKKYGAMFEYRLIIVTSNEMAGTYRYFYKPCENGCELNSFTFINTIVRLK